MLKKGLCWGCLRREADPRVAMERARKAGFHGVELGIKPIYDAMRNGENIRGVIVFD